MSTGNRYWVLFGVSILSLYLEMVILRWVGSEIRVLAYIQNALLVICILGLGAGSWDCNGSIKLRNSLIPLTFLSLFLSFPGFALIREDISVTTAKWGGQLMWLQGESENSKLSDLLVLLLGVAILYSIWTVFLAIGRIIGRLFNSCDNVLLAYGSNIAGSLAGVWIFAGLSALWTGPTTWMGLLIVIGLVCLKGRNSLTSGLEPRKFDLVWIFAIFLAPLLSQLTDLSLETTWSPYQKLSLRKGEFENTEVTTIDVNNTGYQFMLDLSENSPIRKHAAHSNELVDTVSQYDIATSFAKDPKEVLVLAAGSGNDVAAILRNSKAHVTAVDIDPVIVDWGRKYHPEQPYSSDRVTPVIEDARSFLAHSDLQNDLIVVGLLDSHTNVGTSSLRLDNYIYTVECMRQMKKLLKPGGILSITYVLINPFINDHISQAITEVFGKPPLAIGIPSSRLGLGGLTFIVSNSSTSESELAAASPIADYIKAHQMPVGTSVGSISDDWPFLYLERPEIPRLFVYYFLIIAILVGAAIIRGYNATKVPLALQSTSFFFFLGAAFMILETVMISRAALLFGSMWFVSSLVISGVLFTILMANLIAAFLPTIPIFLIGILLLCSCCGVYYFDMGSLAAMSPWPRALNLALIASSPMLFSGILFARIFSKTTNPSRALGANLFGALFGSFLQYSVFIVGFRQTLLLVLGCYVLALTSIARNSHRR